MGPTSVIFGCGALTARRLAEIDELLDSLGSSLAWTRKGKVWNLWVDGRPIAVEVKEKKDDPFWDDDASGDPRARDAQFRVILSAGVNEPADGSVLRFLSERVAAVLGTP